MKDCLEFNVRSGKHVNIAELIDDVELAFKASLSATITAYDTYDRVSEESYNDFLLTIAKNVGRLLDFITSDLKLKLRMGS